MQLGLAILRQRAGRARRSGISSRMDFSPPKPLVKTIAIQFTVSLIASGEFVGILPRSVAALSAHQAALRILPLKSSGPRISAEIVFLKNRTLSPAVEIVHKLRTGSRYVACPRTLINRMAASGGEFNRSLQHILRTSQLASDRARSFSAFH